MPTIRTLTIVGVCSCKLTITVVTVSNIEIQIILTFCSITPTRNTTKTKPPFEQWGGTSKSRGMIPSRCICIDRDSRKELNAIMAPFGAVESDTHGVGGAMFTVRKEVICRYKNHTKYRQVEIGPGCQNGRGFCVKLRSRPALRGAARTAWAGRTT